MKRKEERERIEKQVENEPKKRKLSDDVKDGIKDLKVNEKGEGPSEGRDTN